MARTQPYQPSLLRVLHGITAILVLAAIATGYWVYDTFDGRFGRLALPRINPIIDIHGTIGLTFFLFVPLFFIYSLWLGRSRLVQGDTLTNLTKNVGKPIWWVSLQRSTNTAMLVAAFLAVLSGKLMDETWLPQGQLDHAAYYFHLIAWVIIEVCLILHLLMSAKVGGAPLLLSMLNWRIRPDDSPKSWLNQIRRRS